MIRRFLAASLMSNTNLDELQAELRTTLIPRGADRNLRQRTNHGIWLSTFQVKTGDEQ